VRTVGYRQHPTSYFSQLWKEPERYFTLMLRVYDDLLQSYLASSFSPERKAVVRRRNALIHHAVTAILHMRKGEQAALAAALNDFDRILSGEPSWYWGHLAATLTTLVWFSYGRDKEAIYSLLDAYPGTFTGPKKAMVYVLNDFSPQLRSYVRYYLRHPRELQRLYPLALRLFGGTWRRYKRLLRPAALAWGQKQKALSG
jgi:hypothetical protein